MLLFSLSKVTDTFGKRSPHMLILIENQIKETNVIFSFDRRMMISPLIRLYLEIMIIKTSSRGNHVIDNQAMTLFSHLDHCNSLPFDFIVNHPLVRDQSLSSSAQAKKQHPLSLHTNRQWRIHQSVVVVVVTVMVIIISITCCELTNSYTCPNFCPPF